MALWFLRGLRRGVVTTRYPKAVDAVATTFPTPPAFRSHLLTPALARALEASCPSGALWRERGSLLVDLGACTACGECERVAPEVVRPSGMFELATTDRSRLVKAVPIAGTSR